MYLISYIGWRTANDNDSFPDDAWIQNWVQWEDAMNPGMYMSATCNVEWQSREDSANRDSVVVGNFYGESIDADNFKFGTWDQVGNPIPTEIAPAELLYQVVPESEGKEAWEESYMASNVEGQSSEQRCLIWKPSWTITNGVPDVPEMNAAYIQWMKEVGSIETYTGFRMWNRYDDTEPSINENAGSFLFMAADWSADGVVSFEPGTDSGNSTDSTE